MADRLPTASQDALDAIGAACAVVDQLCHGTRAWALSIPARETDPDLVIRGALLVSAHEITALRARLAHAHVRLQGHDTLVRWLLGESGEFPAPPDREPNKAVPLYWWRSALRQRHQAIVDNGLVVAQAEPTEVCDG